MKCYLINLDRAPERLARMEKILTDRNVPFERVPAIDKLGIPAEDLEQYFGEQLPGRGMNPGDIACGLTHMSIFQRLTESDDEYAAIMEDDVYLSDAIGKFLSAEDWIPDDADIVKLETYNQATVVERPFLPAPDHRKIARLKGEHLGAALYVVSKPAARRILSEYTAGMMCIDQYMFGVMLASLNAYQVFPAPAVQDKSRKVRFGDFLASDITGLPEVKGQMTVAGKLRREAIRVIDGVIFRVASVFRFILLGDRHGKIPFKA